MGTNVLGQFLRSICSNSDWKYAVFWKRTYHQNQTMLIWEDGYCDNLKPSKANHGQKNFIPGCGEGVHNSNGCPVEIALSDMACAHYIMGEGVVGEVAYMGTDLWTSFEDILAVEHLLLIPKLPTEWLPQIEAGIKTILLVAVAPYGVLQLGSLEVVNENKDLVARIQGEFSAIQNRFPAFCSSSSDSVDQSTSSLESIFLENANVSAIVTETFPNDTHCEDLVDETAGMAIPLTPDTGNDVMQHFSFDDIFQESGGALFDSLFGLLRDDSDIPFAALSDIKEEEWDAFSQLVGTGDDEPSSGNISSQKFEDFMETFYEADNIGADHISACSIFGIPSEYDLCEAVVPDFQQQNSDDGWETSMPSKEVHNFDAELIVHELSGWYSQENDVKDRVGAVVASSRSEFHNSLFNNDSVRLVSEESTEPFSSFSLSEYLFERGAFFDEESDCLSSQVTSVFAPTSRGSSTKLSSSTANETVMGKLNTECFPNEVYGDKKSSIGLKPMLRKTRDKPIYKEKRRPRDRQLIQDRLKVLRDLVPNGEKFSIDGLLERTIKHMMFLRKVSDQSHKLRAYQEVDGVIKPKSSQTKDSTKSGASWAYHVGSEHDVFPISVEDLDIPGHMLIEMLCNDHDLFLEVAQVICGLDLTIVKGGMKMRSNSSWAQFVVEVNKGFQRMDVFWPLMQLLQRNPKLTL